MMLYADGSPERMAKEYLRLPEKIRSNIIWTRTVSETIGVLKEYANQLTKVSMEYIFNKDNQGDSRREDCGMEIVRFLEKQDVNKYNHIVFYVHTWKDIQGKKMVERLTQNGYTAKYKPFGT